MAAIVRMQSVSRIRKNLARGAKRVKRARINGTTTREVPKTA
jgi:hypothetical protein